MHQIKDRKCNVNKQTTSETSEKKWQNKNKKHIPGPM
jgi:hypothetical protein